MKMILKYLQPEEGPSIQSEAANVLLNLCYERTNVELFIQHDGASILTDALASSSSDVQANAAGAIQSICFQVGGCREQWFEHLPVSYWMNDCMPKQIS